MGVHLMGMRLIGMHLVGVRVYLIGVHLTGMYIMSMYLMGMHLMGMRLMGMHLMGVHLMGVHLIAMHVHLGCFLSHAKLPWHLSCRVIIFSRNHCYCTTISWWAAGVVGEQASWEVAGSRGPSRCRGRQRVVVGGSR
jgi:hypothetical protein